MASRFTTTEGPLDEIPFGDIVFEVVGTSSGSRNASYIGHSVAADFTYEAVATNSLSGVVLDGNHLYLEARNYSGAPTRN